MHVAQPPCTPRRGREQQEPAHRLGVDGEDQAPGYTLETSQAGGQAAVVARAVGRDRHTQAAVPQRARP